ncbi:hypothetical protein DFH06DRAFT_1320625 [Mycena polygramma]|nr:hypothetical protein DFH06DRAFT_1320625 [Mycena polygramma]
MDEEDAREDANRKSLSRRRRSPAPLGGQWTQFTASRDAAYPRGSIGNAPTRAPPPALSRHGPRTECSEDHDVPFLNGGRICSPPKTLATTRMRSPAIPLIVVHLHVAARGVHVSALSPVTPACASRAVQRDEGEGGWAWMARAAVNVTGMRRGTDMLSVVLHAVCTTQATASNATEQVYSSSSPASESGLSSPGPSSHGSEPGYSECNAGCGAH